MTTLEMVATCPRCGYKLRQNGEPDEGWCLYCGPQILREPVDEKPVREDALKRPKPKPRPTTWTFNRLLVLSALRSLEGPASTQTIAHLTGIQVSTTGDKLKSLEEGGYVEKMDKEWVEDGVQWGGKRLVNTWRAL